MRYRALGATGFDVSVLGFGAASISGEGGGYGFGAISEADSIRLVHEAIDAGINLFDTAPVYGFGVSEQRLGKALADRRDKAFVVSKSGITWSDNKRLRTSNAPDVTRRMLEQSLRDLQTDVIDLYLVHWPDERVDIRDTVRVLDDAKREGKIRHIGLSNTYRDDIDKASEVTTIEVLQGAFHLFQPKPREELFPIARERELGFMSWGTLDKGILTGRVTRKRAYDRHDVRGIAPWWKNVDHEPKFRAMDRIMTVLGGAGHSGLEMAMGWVLGHDEVSTALVGVKSHDQLATAVAALDHFPPPEILAEVEQIAREEVSA